MLESPTFKIDGKPVAFFTNVRSTEDLPETLQYWMAHMAREMLLLGVYFRAAVLMHQLPGAARYRFVMYDDNDDDQPNADENPWHWVRRADRDIVLNVLAECLQRLGAAGVMKQVPGGKDYERIELSAEWQDYLDRQAKIKHGLLSVIAECLDELIVRPGMAEIDVEPNPTWWQRWWSRME